MLYKWISAGGEGQEGSFQVKQHPKGFTGNGDDIMLSMEPNV